MKIFKNSYKIHISNLFEGQSTQFTRKIFKMMRINSIGVRDSEFEDKISKRRFKYCCSGFGKPQTFTKSFKKLWKILLENTFPITDST